MMKTEFMRKLSAHLKKMPKLDRDEIMADFEEYFDAAQRDNEDEQVLCERLGDPKKIAKEYFMQKYIEEANKEKTFKSMTKAIGASAGLGFLNFLYVLCVVIVGYIVLSVLYITVCSIGLSGIAVIIAAIIFSGAYYAFAVWFVIVAGIGLIAFGVLGFIGTMKLAKLFRTGNMHFLNMTRREIRKGIRNE